MSIIHELCWLLHYIEIAPPIHIFSAISWDFVKARSAGLCQLEVFTNVSSIALAYYFTSLQLAYHAPLSPNSSLNTIFWFGALAVCAAIHHAANVWVNATT